MKKIAFLLLLLFSISFSFAQEIKWDGEIRVRSEFDNRDFNSSTPPNYYTLLRARFGAFIQPIQNVKVYLQIQDSRTFGEERDALLKFNTTSNIRNLDLSQGYLQMDNFLFDNLSMKLGRMKLFYGNERIIGQSNWSNIGRSFDGGFLSYAFSHHKFDAFIMNIGETTVPPASATPNDVMYVRDYGQLFSGFYYTNKYFTDHQIDLYLLHQLDRKVSVPGYNDLNRFTAGGYGKGSLTKEIFYEADIAFQLGTSRDKDITASLFGLTAGYKFENSHLSSVSISYERLSGAPDGASNVQTFDSPFGTGHKFYGYIDYFVNIPRDTKNRGLQDLYARAVFQPSDNTTLSFTLHTFSLAESLTGEKALGQELDIVGNWKYNKFVSFEVVGSLFFPGKVMRTTFNDADVSQWAYLTALVSI
jgi:hypothetical protein